ncbi:hypothetical protein KEM55_009029, partial [Ascosphaera atra]
HALAQLVAPAARLQTLALRKQTVTGPKSTAVRKGDRRRRGRGIAARLGLDGLVRGRDVHEPLEPRHDLRVGTDEALGATDEDILINQICAVQVAQLQELPKSLLVAHELLDTVKKRVLLT